MRSVTATHSWVDLDLLIESLRESYRATRRAYRDADKSRKARDVHALRRLVRKLRYQLELLASARPPAAEPAAPAATPAAAPAATPPGAPAVATPAATPEATPGALPEPNATVLPPVPRLSAVVTLHVALKALVKDPGAVTDPRPARSSSRPTTTTRPSMESAVGGVG
jgi:hypothetical protein